MRPRIGIVTISDRASTGVYEDLSGPAIRATLLAPAATDSPTAEPSIPDPSITEHVAYLADFIANSPRGIIK